MRRIVSDWMVIYRFELLAPFPGVTHAVSTRHGGVSPAPFDQLNLSTHVGDEAPNVAENHARLFRALALSRAAVVDASQAQADKVARVTERDRGTRVQGIDGLITNSPGVPLMLRFADCVPTLLYDPAHSAIGIAHAGWRGTVGKVVTHTVEAMQQAFGTRPEDLIAGVGPSIGPCCYEIGPDVQTRVREAYGNDKLLLVPHRGKVHLDLWEANAQQLRDLGVGQIEVAGICTSDHTEDFYSWRREHGHTGRFAAIISL